MKRKVNLTSGRYPLVMDSVKTAIEKVISTDHEYMMPALSDNFN